MIYKLFGTSTASSTENGLATLDIQEDGFITAASININLAGADLLNDGVRCEVSFMSSNTFAVNDTRGSIFQHSCANNFLTTGGGVGSATASIGSIMVPVEAGERIHVHTISNGGATGNVTIYLYVEDSQDAKQRPKRRLR